MHAGELFAELSASLYIQGGFDGGDSFRSARNAEERSRGGPSGFAPLPTALLAREAIICKERKRPAG